MKPHSIVKFQVEFLADNFVADKRLAELCEWCFRFNAHGLTPRCDGTGHSLGNLSYRLESGKAEFIITGSGLDSKERLEPRDFVKVLSADPVAKRVLVEGKRDPSSESILHYEIYRARPDVGAVFHGHDHEMLSNARRLQLPETSQEELPGSVELLRQVMKILGNHHFLIMRKHGFLALGRTMSEAGNLALQMKQR
jgi:L-fuculose-phosphate aldolase